MGNEEMLRENGSSLLGREMCAVEAHVRSIASTSLSPILKCQHSTPSLCIWMKNIWIFVRIFFFSF